MSENSKGEKFALLSVSDKAGIVDFARGLVALGYKILSTGGTLRLLSESGIAAQDVSLHTGFPEMFEGRVKTLHPKIHGGILFRRDNAEDVATAARHGIGAIDLVCVNLYPFEATIKKLGDLSRGGAADSSAESNAKSTAFDPANFAEIIENIDIGGPAMIRAAAKNFKDVVVVTGDYEQVLATLKAGRNTMEWRRALMIKAFEHTAAYDAMIANYMNLRFNDGFGAAHFIAGKKVLDTRYGENPHQQGALYEFDSYFSKNLRAVKGEASFNNLTDINAAMRLATGFGERPCVAIVKHGNPCGFAMKSTLLESYTAALACDTLSAYGGVVAVNGVVDLALAREMNKIFVEVLVCGGIEADALAEFSAKKKIKIFVQDSKHLSLPSDALDFKHIEGGFLLQNSDFVGENEVKNARCVSEVTLESSRFADLEIAWKIAAFTKSNCVAYVKDAALVAIGMGMTSRVDASIAALKKAADMGLDTRGCVFASEAFLPFSDSVEMAHKAGAVAIIQPGGSLRDEEVIAACNKHNIALYFTGVRHFLH